MSALADIDDTAVEDSLSNLVPDSVRFGELPATVGSDAHHPTDSPDDSPRPSSRGASSEADPFAGMDIDELNEITQSIADGRIRLDLPAETPKLRAGEIENPDTVVNPAAEATSEPAADQSHIQALEPAAEPEPDAKKVRARFSDEQDIAIVEMARTEGISLVEATKRYLAERQDHLADLIDPAALAAKPAAAEAPAALPEGIPFASVADADARILELEEARDVANHETFDDAEALRLGREIRAIKAAIPKITRYEQESQARDIERQRETYETTFARSQAEAKAEFPELARPDADQTPLYAEMVRIDQESATTNPSLYADPAKWVTLARLAAANLYRSSSMSVPSTGQPTQPLQPPRNPGAKGISAAPTTARAATDTPAAPGLKDEIANLENLSTAERALALEELEAKLGIRL
jgi:hypothetical protein